MSAFARRVFLVVGIADMVCQPGCMRGGRPDTPTVDGSAWSVVGDTWQFTASAQDPDADNVSFRFRVDSEVDTGWTGYVLSGAELGVDQEWAVSGRHRVAAQARDARGGLSEWSDDCLLTVVPSPGYPDTVARSIVTPHGPDQLAVSPDGARLYVAYRTEGEVSAHVAASGELIGQASVAPWLAYDFALSADGAVLYVACLSRLLVLDARDLSVLDSVVVGARFVRAAPRGDLVYTVQEDTLFAISTATCDVVDTIALGGEAGLFGFGPDGSRCYVALSYGLLVLELPGGGQREYAATPVRSASGLVVAPDGNYVYLLDESEYGMQGVHVFSTTDMRFVREPILLGEEPPYDVALMPSGELLLAADASGDSVVVLRVPDFTVAGSLPVQMSGAVLAVSPDGSRAFATDLHHSRIRVLGYRSAEGAE